MIYEERFSNPSWLLWVICSFFFYYLILIFISLIFVTSSSRFGRFGFRLINLSRYPILRLCLSVPFFFLLLLTVWYLGLFYPLLKYDIFISTLIIVFVCSPKLGLTADIWSGMLCLISSSTHPPTCPTSWDKGGRGLGSSEVRDTKEADQGPIADGVWLVLSLRGPIPPPPFLEVCR